MYGRNYVNTQTFERMTAKEIHGVIIQKESEGWEVIRPAQRVNRNNFEDNHSRVKWNVVMKYVQKTP